MKILYWISTVVFLVFLAVFGGTHDQVYFGVAMLAALVAWISGLMAYGWNDWI